MNPNPVAFRRLPAIDPVSATYLSSSIPTPSPASPSPPAMTMVSSSGGGVHNYEFALKSDHFMDKILCIEIVADDASTVSRQNCPLLTADGLPRQHDPILTAEGLARQHEPLLTADESPRQRKRKRGNGICGVEGAASEGGGTGAAVGEVCTEDLENDDGSPVTPIKRVKRIKVVSVVLALKSEFFKKLFTSPMIESLEKKYTLRITEKEEQPLEQLLNFIYTDKFTTTDPSLLIETLIVADKYHVMNAVDCCCDLLSSLPMSTESAMLYLELPSSSTVVDNALKSLRVSSRRYLVNEYKEIRKYETILLAMPLSAIRAIFSSSDILVPSEDYVFNFLIKWAMQQYKDYPKAFAVFNLYLVPIVRFVHMSPGNLKKLLVCKILDQRKAPMLVITSLLSRSDTGNRCTPLEIEQQLLEQRIYLVKPIRVFDFTRPFNHAVVYMEFGKSDLENLMQARGIVTEVFLVAGQRFHLRLSLREEPVGSGTNRFGMFLSALNMSQTMTVVANFSARSDGEFVTLYDFSAPYEGSASLGIRDLFRVPWHQFKEEGRYLIDDFLYLRVEVKQRLE